jgi:polyisoprenoid-binding protein YceI
MKVLSIVFALLIIMSGNVIYAQKVEINPKKSSVEWLGKKIGGQHEGHIQIKSGSFELVNDEIIAGYFVLDMTSITNSDLEDQNANQKLVAHLKSNDFFGVEKYPTAVFIITKSSKASNGTSKVTGDITIKDKTNSISFNVEQAGNEFTGKIDIDRTKFHIEYGSNIYFFDAMIDDIFTISFKLIVT